MKRRIYLLVLMVFVTGQLFAQSNLGEIKGKLTDKNTKAPVDYADVLVYKDGIRKSFAISDDQGNYYVKALEPGNYSITIKHPSFREAQANDVTVSANKATTVNFEMETDGKDLAPVVFRYKPPIIKQDENTKTITTKDIEKLPTRNIDAIANTTSGASATRSGLSFIGQRADATRTFIDGIPVIGSANLPQSSIGQIDIIQSGVPAQFGDFTGGAKNITTKGPSRSYFKSLELISSSMFNPYHYNQVEISTTGPLVIKNKGSKEKEYVAWGYQLAGQLNYQKDPSPGYGGMYVVKDAKLKEIEENPLAPSPVGGGFVPRSSFLTQDDLVKEKARKNVAQIYSSVQGKLEYQPNRNTTVTAFGQFNYSTGNQFQYAENLLNYKQNRSSTEQTYRTYLKFTQRLRSTNENDKTKGDSSKPLLTDAFYTVRVDYQTRFVNVSNPDHGDNFFDYGYLGKVTRHRAPVYNYNTGTQTFIDQKGDTVTRTGFWELVGNNDTLITYQPGHKNDIVSRYTENFFNNANEFGQKVTSENQIIQGQGLLNGMGPQNTYSLWNNPGTVSYFYEKNQIERLSAYAMGEASLNLKNRHDLQFGLVYEQNISSRYAVAPFGLWRLMPLLVNGHITLDDQANNGYATGINAYDANENFLDTISYNSKVDYSQQSTFDKNLRKKLIDSKARDVNGNLYTENSFIDIGALDPSMFSINMFSSDELWNNGGTYHAYYGYDYLGNRVRTRPSINNFLNDKQNRPVGSFAPVYNAAWIQDKFSFKDLIFRVGVRVERYDANQSVLKDPYSLYPIKSVGEVKELNGKTVQHPGNVESNYAVYVNNTDNPGEIVGYRNGSTWYDANGIEVSSADFIANKTTSGRIQPYLVNPENQKLSKESFEDYSPKVNILPRVWFSFPINTEAQFFANYDVMAQRPPDGATFVPINTYYFLEANQGGTIPNAALKPRIRTNYEFGFKQKIGETSALSIIATYAETRGDFGLIRVNQAYPIAYNTRGNIDFSTTKAFRVEYELQGEGRVSLTANYTLLFADGTGSNINSQAALIAANQPNLRSLYPLDVDIRHKFVSVLDYRFKSGNDYDGPIWGKKNVKVFADAGVNFIFNARSGAPYSRNKQAVSDAQADLGRVQRSQIDGNPFGSRMPWQFKVDMNLSKNFEVKKGRAFLGKSAKKKEGRMDTYRFTAFLWVENLLNRKIVDAVYEFTGLPGDDGYLNSPQGQQYISEQVNSQSFIDLYRAKVDNPYNYIAPRYARLGIKLNF